ncbi:hypothetical protein [Pseudomonas sp. Irchel 3E20]|uniref:hypothetical protein n=1 Tax=Pseudomonas sp. Irchel 3E20 TaxID=2008983 RepID=UPI000BA2FBCB|nr:hypothetical protein [Pseudomonas sp. Irchel 3E20]
MKGFCIVITSLILLGCTTGAKTHVVRGVSGVEINCSGLGSSWERCYKRAARECGTAGYKVITKSSDVNEEPGDYLFGWNPAGYLSRSMLVICR